jgi:large-conductance mechanosensitive channel
MMGKKLWWRSTVAALGLMLKSWWFWLLVAAVYVAFTADWVVAKYGMFVGWFLLLCLISVCLFTILNVYNIKREDSERLANYYNKDENN